MYPVEVPLDTDAEQRRVAVAYENQIQHRESIADTANCSPDTVWNRLEKGQQNVEDNGVIRFDDQLDADLFACAIALEYDSSEQSTMDTTFTAKEQVHILSGLAHLHTVCERVADALGDQTDDLTEDLPSERPFMV